MAAGPGGIAGPDDTAIAIGDKVAVGLHNQRVLAARRNQVLPGLQFLARRQAAPPSRGVSRRHHAQRGTERGRRDGHDRHCPWSRLAVTRRPFRSQSRNSH